MFCPSPPNDDNCMIDLGIKHKWQWILQQLRRGKLK